MFKGSRKSSPVVLNIVLKGPRIIMPNEGEGNDPSPRESREPEDGRIRDVMAVTNVDKRTGELTCNEDDSPSPNLRGVSHDSKATSMIGQGSECLSNTFEQHERSVPTSVLPTQDTQLTSQPLWTL